MNKKEYQVIPLYSVKVQSEALSVSCRSKKTKIVVFSLTR